MLKKLKDKDLELADFSNLSPNVTEYILKNLTPSNQIGKGAVGNVYLIDQKFVVKEIDSCKAKRGTPLYQYCEDILRNKNKFPFIPGGNGKIRYTLPNLLSEILLGMFLGDMKETLSFKKTLGSFLVGNKVYIFMEVNRTFVVDRNLNPYLKFDPAQMLYFLFQISHALFWGQQKHRFTHYDLHIENILWDQWNSIPELKNKTLLSYGLPYTNLLIAKSRFPNIYKIADFGLGRMEIQKTLITPSVETFPVKSYGEFSPSYDFLSLLGSICIDNKYRVIFDPLFRRYPDLYRFLLILILWILNDKELKVGRDLEEARDNIGNKHFTIIGLVKNKFSFRPRNEGTFVPYLYAKSTENIMNLLGRILIRLDLASLSNFSGPSVLKLPRTSKVKKFDNVFLYSPQINISQLPGKGESVGDFRETDIDTFIKVRSYRILANTPPKSYNFTMNQKQTQNCPIQDHYMTAVFVNPKALEKYRFNFECCKLDPVNYLLESNKSGFVINGGFFQIKGNYTPIGLYKDSYSKISNPVPEEYRDVFAYINLKDGKLNISNKPDGKVLTSGPLLISKGKIVFDPKENRFSCDEENNAGKRMISQNERKIKVGGYYKYSSDGENCQKEFVPDIQTYPRCDKIPPGELSHANNPNPRSALCILKDGTYIFLAIEGRGNRGVGMDLFTLATSILNSFPEVESAINLDGGRSSNIAWRSIYEKDKVYISNPDRNYFYPVGDIITFLEK